MYDNEERNVNINEEVDLFIDKLDKNNIIIKDFEAFIKNDWFDLKASNNFEILIDKTILFFLKNLDNPIEKIRFKELKEYQKKMICFLLNGVEEFLFFDGISTSIFTNFIKIPFVNMECLDILLVFFLRNSKKLYFFSAEKKNFLLELMIAAFFTHEIHLLTDESFFKILQIAENLLKNNDIRTFLFMNFKEFLNKLTMRCLNYCQNNTNTILNKSSLMEINFLLVCLKYPDFSEKIFY